MNQNKKAWYKKWWIWVIIVLAIGVIAYMANPNAANEQSDNSQDSSTTQAAKQWQEVSTLTGDLKEKSGDVFTLSGGNTRVKYTVNTTSNSGTALIYLLPEGSTTTQDSNGDLDVAVQDVSTIGSESGEKIIQKPAGNYYLYINTSSVKDYTITVEEQK